MIHRQSKSYIKNKLDAEVSVDTAESGQIEATTTESTETFSTPTPMAQVSQAPLVLVSEIDAYVNERMKSQATTPAEIDAKVITDHDNKNHILKLPTQLEKYGKDYAFRWINKKKRSIDNALDVIGWTFVNRSFFKDLPRHLFTANGSIERGDAILAFMPLKRAIEIRLRPAQISRERVRNVPVQPLDKPWENKGENYYKPDLGAAENDNEKPRGIVVTPDNEVAENQSQQ